MRYLTLYYYVAVNTKAKMTHYAANYKTQHSQPKLLNFGEMEPSQECGQEPTSTSPATKSRLWLFTLYGDQLSETTMTMNSKITYMTFQKEQCPTTNRLHLQGVIRLKDRTTLLATKKILGHPTVHLVPTNNLERGIKYCNKEATRVEGPWTMGTPPHAGQRNDLAALADQIVAGKRPRELAVQDPTSYIRYHKGFLALSHAVHPAIGHPDRRCVLLIGPTGTGKTRLAFDTFEERNIFIVPDIRTPWFDGYEQQQVAIIDECGTDMMHYNYLKRLTDRYPLQVPVKGGMVAWNAKRIILTAQQPMHTWWGDRLTLSDSEALERRIKTFNIPYQTEEAKAYLRGEAVPHPPGGTWGETLPAAAPTIAPTLVDDEPEIWDISD